MLLVTLRITLFIITNWQFVQVAANNGAEYIFYSNSTHISYLSVDGGESTTILSAQSATLAYDEQTYRLWYYDSVGATLHNVKLDSSDARTVTVPSTFGSFTVDAVKQRVYYINNGDNSIKSIDYNGNNLQDIAALQHSSDFRDLQIDGRNRSLFLTTALSQSRNLIRYSLTEDATLTLDNSIPGIGGHLAVDTANKMVYWILFTDDTVYNIYKTTYDGQTSQIESDQTGNFNTVDIGEGNGFFYILDSGMHPPEVRKYNKTTDTVVSRFSLSSGATRMVIVPELTCKVDAIYYATSSAIKGVLSDGNSTVTILSQAIKNLNYDSSSERVIYYNGSKLVSIKLDGSDATTIASVSIILRFAVDHIARKVYYISDTFRRIKSIDLNDGTENNVNSTVGDGVIDDLDTDPSDRSLVFAPSNTGDIVRYHLDTGTEEVIYNNNRDPRYLAVDSDNEVIYWIDHISANDSYALMQTHFNGTTSQVYYYPGTTSSVKIAIGENDFYVMDSTRGRIDIFDRSTVNLQNSLYLSDTPIEITVVKDVDECCVGGYCNENATCTNTPGSYFCTCKTGYTGNSTHCEDIDECVTLTPCDSKATCNDTEGSYTCTCNTGYSGDGFNCSDIDECVTLTPCDGNATCNDTEGSYTCTCNTGYSGDGFNCSDIDECVSSPCHANATCNDTEGSYTCTCNTGYTGDGFNCSDIDECVTLTPCDGNATCNDAEGFYTCICNTGYSGDGFNCSDIDECVTLTPCDGNATCNDTEGTYTCTCNTGYTGDGFNCTDIDECVTLTPCDGNATCNDTEGSYTCTCNTGYTGNGFNCTERNLTTRKPPIPTTNENIPSESERNLTTQKLPIPTTNENIPTGSGNEGRNLTTQKPPIPTTNENIPTGSGNEGEVTCSTLGCDSSGTVVIWHIVVALLSGIIIGVLFSYIFLSLRRCCDRNKKPESNSEQQTDGADRIYEDLDLTKMNTEDNYQSLSGNTAASAINVVANDEDSTYTPLSEIRDVENNYQSLT